MLVLAAAGWAAAVVLVLRARREAARVARAAHEVRGPLQALTFALEAAGRRGEVTTLRRAGLEIEVGRVARALGDLAGDAAPDADAPVDLRALAEVQAATFGARTACAPGRLVVRGDAVRLAQALGNVLRNAAEHGGGAVRLRAHGAGGRVRLEVTDDGAGLHRLPDARPHRGARGHGLAVAAEVARAHGGRLLLEDGRVVLDLPAWEGPVAGSPTARAAPAGRGLPGADHLTPVAEGA